MNPHRVAYYVFSSVARPKVLQNSLENQVVCDQAVTMGPPATVLAALALQEFEAFDSEAAAKRNITRAIEQVAGRLGNTVSICRKCYIHPDIFDGYLDGTLAAGLKADIDATLSEELDKLSPEEAAVLAFLQRRLGETADCKR